MNSESDVVVSSPEYLTRFRSVFPLILITWTVKNDIDANLFNLYRKAVTGLASNRV